MDRAAGGGRVGPEKALDALLLAAPNKGEVQPWVWLLGAVAQRCAINSVHAGVTYLVCSHTCTPLQMRCV